jgi:hypothetical protein
MYNEMGNVDHLLTYLFIQPTHLVFPISYN